jgi:4'-phosphopantetheinyl transferase
MHDRTHQPPRDLDAKRVDVEPVDTRRVDVQPVHARHVDVERVGIELVDAKRVRNEPLNAERVVEVWRVDLRLLGSDPLRLLNASERARAARIANPARRALWMRGRGMLRTLLGEYLGLGGEEIELVAGRHGKPALAGGGEDTRGTTPHAGDSRPAREPPVYFNLAHSGPLALYAFTATAPVGVDVELLDPRRRDEVALAERAFGLAVAQRLSKLDGPARRREFLRLWVRHEAALKCLGVGLAGAGAGANEDTDTAKLWIADVKLGPDAAAALALQGEPLKLRLREWPH